MAFSDYFKGPHYRAESEQRLAEIQKLNAQVATLSEQIKELGGLDLQQIRARIEKEKTYFATLQASCDAKLAESSELTQKIEQLRADVLVVEEIILLESFAHYLPKFSFTNSEAYKTRLDGIREQQKALIKNGGASLGGKGWTVNNSEAQGRKLVNDMVKLQIRSFNNEADYCVDNVKFNNIEAGEKRIRKSFETLNKLGQLMNVRLSEDYLNLKLDELRLAFEYQVKKQEEKEEAKRAREELREQQKLEQEIRAAREKIAKERKHFVAAIKDLEARLQTTINDEERAAIEAKMAEVKQGFTELDSEEKLIDYREQNAKAGYVYVISNIGAFGEGVFKIGMTRRLEPMDRVDELGDASVPFTFDIHALVFSENAPALEAKLHEHFEASRINKVNARKEFFRANITEIELVIRQNFDAAVEIVHEAAAEQYRESLRIN